MSSTAKAERTPQTTAEANQLIRDLNPMFVEIASLIESWRTTTTGEIRTATPVEVAALRETLGGMIESGRDVVAILATWTNRLGEQRRNG